MAKESLDDLLKKTTINFPNSLTPKEVRILFKYLAKELKCEIRCVTDVQERFGDATGEKPRVYERFIQKIAGNMNVYKNLSTFIQFGLNVDYSFGETRQRFNWLRFDVVPGCSAENMPREMSFIDSVRTSIEKYFKQKGNQ